MRRSSLSAEAALPLEKLLRVVALSGAALLLGACVRNAPVAGVKVDPALLILVPEDTTIMAGMRVEALQKTSLYQKYLAGFNIPQIDNFMRATGLDARKNLWELLYISNGRRGVLLGRGKFSNEEEPRLERDGIKRFGYKNFTLLGDEKSGIVFINSSTAGAGEISALKSLIDQMENSHGAPPAMTALMKDIPPDAQIWAAYSGGGSIDLNLPGNFANATKVMDSIETGTVYLDLRGGLKAVASGLGKSEQTAQDLQGALQALMGMARLSAPSNQPEAQRIYDSIHVARDARRVTVSMDEPEESVEKLLESWGGRRR